MKAVFGDQGGEVRTCAAGAGREPAGCSEEETDQFSRKVVRVRAELI